jgi:hypothetical protein
MVRRAPASLSPRSSVASCRAAIVAAVLRPRPLPGRAALVAAVEPSQHSAPFDGRNAWSVAGHQDRDHGGFLPQPEWDDGAGWGMADRVVEVGQHLRQQLCVAVDQRGQPPARYHSGVGPITASAIVAAITDPTQFGVGAWMRLGSLSRVARLRRCMPFNVWPAPPASVFRDPV